MGFLIYETQTDYQVITIYTNGIASYWRSNIKKLIIYFFRFSKLSNSSPLKKWARLKTVQKLKN